MTTASTTAALADVRDALHARHERTRSDLEALVRIPSVSTGPDPAAVRRCAEAVRDLLAARGFARARLLEVDGAHPAVTAEVRTAPPGAPTVLLYAHHDVQPAGDPAAWTSPPFAPTERDGRLYGRGAADDKAGIAVHVAAVAAWLEARGALPVDVVVLVEGEEEAGSAHLDTFLERYGEDLRADVVVVPDSVNWAVGVPSLTYLLRGNLVVDVTVAALGHGLHSGLYGGPVPDALTGLVRLLATLTDTHGAVAVPGFADDARPLSDRERTAIAALDFDERAFRAEAGLLDGVRLAGDPTATVLERLWARPTATVTGVDAPPVAEASNTLVPTARARVSLRLAPGQDPGRAAAVLRRHLETAVPWGLHLDVAVQSTAPPWVADPDVEPTRAAMAAAERALAAAFGRPAVRTGVGGSIPFLPAIAQRLGDPAILLTGVEDPDTRAHAVDESLHLGDFARACLAEAHLFAELAGGGVA